MPVRHEEEMIECPFCGADIPVENVGACLLEADDIVCHECRTVLVAVLEIKEG